MRRLYDVLGRAGFAPVWTCAALLLLALHADCLRDPPYWDALMGAFAQGHWHATHSFSLLELLKTEPVFNDGGACVYPFSVYPLLVGALERFEVARETAFLVLHLLSIAAGATVASVTFLVARRLVGAGLGALVALALVAQPSFRALVAQLDLDILLGAATVLAWRATSSERHLAACGWSACALLLKPTGVIVVAACLASLVARLAWPVWFEGAEARRPAVRRAALVQSGLFLVFVAELVVVARLGKSPPGVSLLGGTLPFLGKRIWTLPEFGINLVLVALCTPWLVRRAVRRRSEALVLDAVALLAAFTGFYCQYQNVLPRYLVQAWPFVLVLLAAAARPRVPTGALALVLVVFAVFGVVNAHGRFHPTKHADWNLPGSAAPLVTTDGWLLERSLEYRDGLELDRRIAARCQAERDAWVVAGWPVLQLLAVPRLGYVDVPPRLAAAETPIDYAAGAIEVSSRLRPRPAFVRVITPNVYAGTGSRVWPEDEVLESFTSGRLQAFLVRRAAVRDVPGR